MKISAFITQLQHIQTLTGDIEVVTRDEFDRLTTAAIYPIRAKLDITNQKWGHDANSKQKVVIVDREYPPEAMIQFQATLLDLKRKEGSLIPTGA